MANYVNPVASVASFKNQQLGSINSGYGTQVTPALGLSQSPARERMAQGNLQTSNNQKMLSGITDSATRQHQLRLQAIKTKVENERKAAEQAAAQRQWGSAGGGGSYGGAGNPKGLVGQYKLLPGADAAYQQLNAAFQQQFGYALPVASGGRTYADQQYLYNLYLQGKGNLAAKPGTSEHESGRAIDFGGAAHNAGTRENNWLVTNAGNYGFKWTGKNFKQFEPWHFEWWR